jgi:PGF-CTERM protein
MERSRSLDHRGFGLLGVVTISLLVLVATLPASAGQSVVSGSVAGDGGVSVVSGGVPGVAGTPVTSGSESDGADAAADARLVTRMRLEVEDTSGNPLGGIEVEIVNLDNGSVVRTVTTASDGTWGPAEFPPANYTARIAEPGWKSFATRVNLEDGEAEKIQVTGERQTGQLRLAVEDTSGNPFGGIAVEVVNLDNGSVVRQVTTASDGTWGPERMPAGNYTARIAEPGWKSFGTRVNLEDGEAEKIQVTGQSSSGSLEGTVTDAGGSALADATVQVVNTSNGSVVATLPVASGGSWGAVELPRGSYRVVATSNGYEPASRTVSVGGSTRSVALSLAPALSASITSTTSPVATGETLSVTARIENTASSEVSGTVVLDVGGTRRDATTLTLSGGEARTVTFEWQTGSGDAGSYTASVDTGADTATTSVTVAEPSGLSVDISSTDSPVAPGETLSVDVRVDNTGSVEVTETVALVVDGEQRDSRGVTLSPGDARTITLTWSDATAGEYTATVEGASDSDSTGVAVRSPAALTVDVAGTNGPLSPGDQLQVEVAVENTGGAETTETVTLSVEGTELDSREVTLSGGESRTLTLAGVLEEPGTVDVVVSAGDASASATVTVEGGTATSTRTQAEGVAVPGFGAGVALVALAAVALAVRRRR